MNKEQESEINAFSDDQLRTLFWQVYGWMSVKHETEMDMAVESAVGYAKREGV